MKKIFVLAMVIGLSLILTSNIGYTQDNKMQEIDTWECGCKYNTRSTQNGNFLLKDDFYIIFSINKYDKKSAMIKTIFEVDHDAMVIPNMMGGVNILQITKTGGIATTTIDLQGNSVHSRNIIIKGVLIPSQYYGKCVCAPK